MDRIAASADAQPADTLDYLDADEPIAPTGSHTGSHTIEIELLPRAQTAGNYRYRVWHRGAVLIDSKDPELDACRVLLALGLTGTVTSYAKGGAIPAMVIDIERGAQLRTIDTAKDGPRFARWRPFDRFDGSGEAAQDQD